MRRARTGNIIVIVSILAAVIFVSLFALGFLTKTDVRTSSNLLREMLATSLAESIATQIEAQANSRPWVDRFWDDPSVDGPPMMTFGKEAPYVNLANESLSASEYDYAVVVKDLPSELREYRVFVSVTVKDETFNFNWDKRWEMALLTGLNRDTTMLDKALQETDPDPTDLDTVIDDIKGKMDAAPPPDKSPQAQRARIRALRRDEKSFKGSASLTKGIASPAMPPAP